MVNKSARDVNRSFVVASLWGRIILSLELYHPLGVCVFGRKPLYSPGFLRFSVSYLGIRVSVLMKKL